MAKPWARGLVCLNSKQEGRGIHYYTNNGETLGERTGIFKILNKRDDDAMMGFNLIESSYHK
jgi:hypothetical protein